MSNTLRLGMVGCGDIAQYTAWIARINRRIKIVACCDIDQERVQQFSRRFSIQSTYTDYLELINREQLDCVYLAVPHNLHHDMIQQAVIIGIPVFVEKPITCTLKEGMDIVQVASEQNIQVGVNYQYRYDSGCYALVRAVQTGNLGEIYYARCNIPWYRDLNYFKDSGWHSNLTSSCGGTLLTQGSHILDIALWALGGKPTSAFGVISQKKFKDVEVEDLALGTIEMNNGALIQISSSMIANPEQAISIEVYGEIGTAIYTDKPLPKVRFRGTNLKKEKPPVWGIHALQRSLEAYRLWVMENKPYLTPAREALPVLAAIEALYRSAKSGQKEQVEILSD